MKNKSVERKMPVRRVRRYVRVAERDVKLIVQLIDDWHGMAPTWTDVVSTVHEKMKVRWSRQTLEKRPEIKDAYLRRRAKNRSGSNAVSSGKGSVAREADRRIENLKAENEKLRATLLEYDRRLMTYVTNAIAHGLSEADLNAPVRPISNAAGDRRRR